MNTISTLVKMQLKEKLNKRGSSSAATTLRIIFKAILAIFKFAIASVACFALFYVAKIYQALGTSIVPNSFMAFIFSVLFVISLISCTVRITKAIYFAKDNVILLTLPCTPSQVFLSKLLVFFTQELKKNMLFFVPMFLGYFLAHGHPVIFYPWIFLCFVFISVFTVAFGAFLSIPAMWIATVLRQRKILQAVLIVLGFALVVIALFVVINSIPQELDLRKGWKEVGTSLGKFFENFANSTPALYYITKMLTGEMVVGNFAVTFEFGAVDMLVKLALLILAIAVLFLLCIIVVNPLFYSMASKPFEYLKAKVKARPNKARRSWVAPFHTEVIKTLKDSSKLAYGVGLMVATPVLVFILNTIFTAMPTDDFGQKLITASNILIILLIALNANSYAASVFSRDGRSAYLIKVQPKNPTALLLAKLFPTTVFCVLSFVLTAVSMICFSGFAVLDTLAMIIGTFFVYLAHLLHSAELDIINPHTEIYAAVGEYENDPNEIKSSSLAFTLSFVIAAFMLLLLFKESILRVCIKFAIVALLAFSYKLFLFFTNIKLYYKEK